jgi:inosine-uridine nucleoside N-ribohydrolase/formylmethanofuran dehydrogenase subunit E
MKNTIVSLLLILFTTSLTANPLHLKLKHKIIIDTDCDNNDLRAISLLLSHSGITIKAILISDGRTQHEEGIEKIRGLLNEFKADSIPIIFGRECKGTKSTRERGKNNEPSALSVYDNISKSKELVTIVCLGPMTNLSKELQNNSGAQKNIEEIIWYSQSVDPLKGFNYNYDNKAVNKVFITGININIISSINRRSSIFSPEFIDIYRQSNTSLAKVLYKIHKLSSTADSNQNDELAAIFLTNPELFEMITSKEQSNVHYNYTYNVQALKEVLSDMINGNYRAGHFVAFYGFPADPKLYVYDIRSIMDSAIARYGIDEWKACVMTDEFHGHLGVFSIVGAKMGISAREYFDIGSDLLEVKTYAGTKPPFSCMNDGLQVSTGATLGQGTIHLINDSVTKPQAIFKYENQSIMITLKEKYLKDLQAVIAKGIKDYGLQNEGYWTLVRQTSIKFWLEWDRKEIFEIVKL